MPSPGPLADQAFRIGLVATVVLTLTTTGTLFWLEHIDLQTALLILFLGLPIIFILVACLLGVWLGYTEEPLVRVEGYEHEWPLDREGDRPPEQ